MPAISHKTKGEIFAVVAYVLQNTYNLVSSRCCFAENGREMFKDSKRTCMAIANLTFCLATFPLPLCCRGLLKFPI